MDSELSRITRIYLNSKLKITVEEEDAEITEFLNSNSIEMDDYIKNLHDHFKELKGKQIKLLDYYKETTAPNGAEYNIKDIKIDVFNDVGEVVSLFSIEELQDLELHGVKGHVTMVFDNDYFLIKFEGNPLETMMFPSGVRFDEKEIKENVITVK